MWSVGQDTMRFIRFCKPYEGKFWRDGKYLEGIRFYDEREWRFVPDINPGADSVTVWLSKETYLDDILLSEANEILADKHKLHFNPDDIKYIIVEREDQVLSIIKAVEKITDRFDRDTIKKLTSRIITREQIIEDF